MSDQEGLKQAVCRAVDRCRKRIVDLGEAVMDTPELGFKETRTAARVRQAFVDAGLPVDEGLALTGVRGVLRGGRPGPTVALMGELDALILPDHPRADPETGAAHACGHNAQIAGLVGAALGLCGAGVVDHLSGTLVFLAVPAEEYVEIEYRLGLVRQGRITFLSGKPELLHQGVFDDVDMALMVHTGSADHLPGPAGVAASSNGFLAKSVRFLGRAAHAGVAPEQGVNALSAASLALQALHAQRETFRDADCVRVHPILTRGGDLVNIVPSEARLESYVRARTAPAMFDAAAKFDRAVKGAALACGCTVEIETVPGYLPLINDASLARLFRLDVEPLFGPGACCRLPHSGGSTDAGDLSQVMPVLHPVMTGAAGTIHGKDWQIADPEAAYLAPAKVLAMMAVDLLAHGAAEASRVLAAHRPALSKTDYLAQQRALFDSQIFDPGSVA